jgi:integrase
VASIQSYDLTLASGKVERRHRAFYRDAAGRNVGRVFKTKRDAEAFLRSVVVQEVSGTLGDSRAGRKTFQALWEDRHAAKPFAASTLELEGYIGRVALPLIGNRPIGAIDTAAVERVLGHFNGPSMKDKARRVLSAVFGFAVENRWLAVNPAKRPKSSTTRQERIDRGQSSAKKADRYLNDDQLARLLVEIPDRYKALVELMARVGLRPGEAYALKVGKVDPVRRTLLVDESVEGFTKTGEPRTVTLPAVVAESVVEHVARYSKPKDPAALIFPNRNGKMLNRDAFRHVFQRASVRAGVNHGLSPNHLRHTAAAFAIHHGASVYDVQRMLGHSKPSITLDVYGHIWDQSGQRLAEKLDAAIRQGEIQPKDAEVVSIRR